MNIKKQPMGSRLFFVGLFLIAFATLIIFAINSFKNRMPLVAAFLSVNFGIATLYNWAVKYILHQLLILDKPFNHSIYL